jgi:hypothetical protein
MKAQRIRAAARDVLSAGEDFGRCVLTGADLTDCTSTNLSDEGVQADDVFHPAWDQCSPLGELGSRCGRKLLLRCVKRSSIAVQFRARL